MGSNNQRQHLTTGPLVPEQMLFPLYHDEPASFRLQDVRWSWGKNCYLSQEYRHKIPFNHLRFSQMWRNSDDDDDDCDVLVQVHICKFHWYGELLSTKAEQQFFCNLLSLLSEKSSNLSRMTKSKCMCQQKLNPGVLTLMLTLYPFKIRLTTK